MPRPWEIEFEVELPFWWWAREKPVTPEEKHVKLLSERMRTRLHKEREMLKDREDQLSEDELRRLRAQMRFVEGQIRDNSPMVATNGLPAPQRELAIIPPALLERCKKAPKLAPVDLNSDYSVESTLRDAGFKGKPGEFFGTFGLSRPQVLAMPAAEIKAHIDRVRGSDDFAPTRSTPRPAPQAPRNGPMFVEVGA